MASSLNADTNTAAAAPPPVSSSSIAHVSIGDGGAAPTQLPQPQPPFSSAIFALAVPSPTDSSPTAAGQPPLPPPTLPPGDNNSKDDKPAEEPKDTEAAKKDKMPVKTRKKGMAVKKPSSSRRRARGGGKSGSKSGGTRKSSGGATKPGASTDGGYKNTTEDDNPQTQGRGDDRGKEEEESQEEEGSGEESQDNGPYCICRGPDDHRWMIGCEICDDWFHGECVGLSKEIGETLVERFVCPNCTDPKRSITTIYKKTCAFSGCMKPARLYGGGDDDRDEEELEVKREGVDDVNGADDDGGLKGSTFCSDEHRDLFWERLLASLPKEKDDPYQDELTQQEVMSLLTGRTQDLEKSFPFVEDPFDPKRAPNAPLTQEEQDYITKSESERREMGEEIGILKKMHRLLELCAKRRTAAIAAGRLEKDICGYDIRLDFVGEPDSFRIFAQTPEIDALFRPGTSAMIGAPRPLPEELAETVVGYHKFDFSPSSPSGSKGGGLYGTDEQVGGMCDKKRCRPHAGWLNIHARNIKYTISRLAEEAAAKLEEEKQIKDHAAVRFLRKSHEKNEVRILEGDEVFRNRPVGGLGVDAMTGERIDASVVATDAGEHRHRHHHRHRLH